MKKVVINPDWQAARYAFELVDGDRKLIKPTPLMLKYSPRYNTEEDAINKINPIHPFVEVEEGQQK